MNEPSATATNISQVVGTVWDEQSRPVAGVLVQIGGLAGKRLSIRTDRQGKFSAALRAGEYRIWATKAHFEPIKARVFDFHEGENRPRFLLHRSRDTGFQRLLNTVAPQRGSATPPQPRPHPDENKPEQKNDVPDISQVLIDRYGEMRTPGAQATASKYLVDSNRQSKPHDFGLTNDVSAASVSDLSVKPSFSGIGGIGPDYTTAGREFRLDSLFREGRWGMGIDDLFPSPQFQRGLRFGEWSPKLTLNGPVGQSVWISDTLSGDHSLLVIPELPRDGDSIEAWQGSNTFRSQFRLAPEHLIGTTFLFSRADDSHIGLTSFTPLSTTVDLGLRQLTFSAYDQHSIGKSFLEFGTQLEQTHSTLFPQGGTPYILYPGSAAGSYFETLGGTKHQAHVYLDLKHSVQTIIGQQDLQFGVDTTATKYDHYAKRNPFEIINDAGELEQLTYFIGDSEFSLRNIRPGAYFQDTWHAGSRVRVEGGLRWSDDTLIGYPEYSPRTAISFLPTPDRKTKLFADWGIYYPKLDLALLGQAQDQLRINDFYNNGVLEAPPQTDDFVAEIPKLRAPYYESYQSGIQQQLGRKTFIGATLSWRYQMDGLAYQKLAAQKSLEQIALFNDRRDSLRSAEFSIRHDFGSVAQVFGSYTRSHTFTNQLFDFDLSSQTYSSQYTGPLDYDSPNRIVSWAWAPILHRSFVLTYLFEYRTGFPFSVFDQDYNLVGTPNSFRFPDSMRLNIGIEKIFNFHGRAFGTRLAIINLTNHRNPIAVDNNVDSPTFMEFDGGLGRAYAVRIRLLESQ